MAVSGVRRRFRLSGSLVFGLLLAVSVPAMAQGPSLTEALVSAYQSNPQLLADRARQRAADEEVSRAWGGMRPIVTFSGTRGRAEDEIKYPPSQYAPTGTRITSFRMPRADTVQLSQSVWDGDRTFSDVEHAKMAVANGAQILLSTEQAVIGEVLQAYYDLYRDQEILKIQDDFVKSLEDERTAVLARYKVKDVTQTDVAQSDARLARGIADAQQYRANVESSRSAFLRAVGFAAPDILADPGALPGTLPGSLADALALAEDNPDLKAAVYSEKAARADILSYESGLMPNLSIQASSSRSFHTDTNMSNNVDNIVELSLTVPLYDGGVASARVRGAKHTAGQQRLNIDVTRDRVVDAIKRSWQSLQAANARIKSYEAAVKAAQVALTGVQQELRVGSRTVIDELNARQELLDANINLLTVRHDRAIAAYGLLNGIGRLTAQGLGLPVEIYDPAQHYDASTWLPWGPWIETDYPETPKMPDR